MVIYIMKNVVVICCNDKYVAKAIVALNRFSSYNPEYYRVIIGTYFNEESKILCNEYDVKLIEINLSSDFININIRPYGLRYPIECFYHFYAYKLFENYDYIIKIEPDIYTNKKIDINFDLIKYIGGSHIKSHTIEDFSAIYKDYENIKKLYKFMNIKQYRILPGVIIYNVKGLESIKFYEKIIEYYQMSIKINCPRCGDDSLIVMYQLLNPSHIFLLKPSFHILVFEQLNNINYNKVTFFHFGGATNKYWYIKESDKLHDIQKFFYDNFIEFVYNNFSLEFIKKYIPNIYLDIKDVVIPFYYYNTVDNFGDLITPYLLNKFCDKDTYKYSFTEGIPKIISCGSIMRMCNSNTIVYGSGIRDIDQVINKGIIKLVRGPLTRNRLLEIECYCPPTYGDPGLLLPLYYNPDIKKIYKLGIIPHHIHYKKIYDKYNSDKDIIVIDLINKNIESVIRNIISCEKTISSSLHGLIVSDAYNIPNKWVKFSNEIYGDDTKYHDYFLSVNRVDTEYIDCISYKDIPENTFDIINDVKISYDINKLQEKFFMNKNGINNYTKYLFKNLLLKKKIINTEINLMQSNEWLAFKGHWIFLNDKLRSTTQTYLKKKDLLNSKLSENDKFKVSKYTMVLYLGDYNKNYYLIQYSGP